MPLPEAQSPLQPNVDEKKGDAALEQQIVLQQAVAELTKGIPLTRLDGTPTDASDPSVAEAIRVIAKIARGETVLPTERRIEAQFSAATRQALRDRIDQMIDQTESKADLSTVTSWDALHQVAVVDVSSNRVDTKQVQATVEQQLARERYVFLADVRGNLNRLFPNFTDEVLTVLARLTFLSSRTKAAPDETPRAVAQSVTPPSPGRPPRVRSVEPPRKPPERGGGLQHITEAEIAQWQSWNDVIAAADSRKLLKTDGSPLSTADVKEAISEIKWRLNNSPGFTKADIANYLMKGRQWPDSIASKCQELSQRFAARDWAAEQEPSPGGPPQVAGTSKETITGTIDYSKARTFRELAPLAVLTPHRLSDTRTNEEVGQEILRLIDQVQNESDPTNSYFYKALNRYAGVTIKPNNLPFLGAVQRLDANDPLLKDKREAAKAKKAAEPAEPAPPPAAVPPEQPRYLARQEEAKLAGYVWIKSLVHDKKSGNDGKLYHEYQIPGALGIPEQSFVDYMPVQTGKFVVGETQTTWGELTFDTQFLRQHLVDQPPVMVQESKVIYISVPVINDQARVVGATRSITRMNEGEYKQLLKDLKKTAPKAEPTPEAAPTPFAVTKVESRGKVNKSIEFTGQRGNKTEVPLKKLKAAFNAHPGSIGNEVTVGDITIKVNIAPDGREFAEIRGKDKNDVRFDARLGTDAYRDLRTMLGLPAEQQESQVNRPQPQFGFAEAQGPRPSMEDAHQYIDAFMSNPDRKYIGVFDGHGGDQVAKAVSNRLHEILAQQLAAGKPVPDALQSSFALMDQELSWANQVGCTAVVAYMDKNTLHVANIGDARAVMSKGKKAHELTHDHKASDPAEVKRIRSAGGDVSPESAASVARVHSKAGNAELAVARAFGDHNYPGVTAMPHLSEFDTTNSEFLILACDGVWDVMKNQEAVDLINRLIASGEKDPNTLANALVQDALSKGTHDNVTASILIFN